MNNCSYHAMPVNDGRLDLSAVITHLGKLGFHDVWVEAGGRVFTALHELALVQTTYLYVAPKILGAKAVSACDNTNFFNRPYDISWQVQADNVIACLQWQENECLQD